MLQCIDLKDDNDDHNHNREKIKPLKIVDRESIIMKHFFQIYQTKTIYLDRETDAAIVCVVASEGELKKLIQLFNSYADRGFLLGDNSNNSEENARYNLCILYCDYDPLYTYSQSREKVSDLEVKKYNIFEQFRICLHPSLKKLCKLYVETACLFLKDKVLDELFFQEKDSNLRRNMIIEMMLTDIQKEMKEFNPKNILGQIGFHWSSFGKKLTSMSEFASLYTFFDKAFSPNDFCSCVLVPGE